MTYMDMFRCTDGNFYDFILGSLQQVGTFSEPSIMLIPGDVLPLPVTQASVALEATHPVI